MTPTTTLPALRDAMTAAELHAQADRLRLLLGKEAHVSLVVSADSWDRADGPRVYIGVYPNGVGSTVTAFTEPTWPEAFAKAEAWIATRPVIARAERVRRMALAIIDIKDQDGSVTERRLRARDFTAAEITDLGAEACARAAELCLGAPFEIVT
jgi:hypothetical protein